jgi:hypothetical protein
MPGFDREFQCNLCSFVSQVYFCSGYFQDFSLSLVFCSLKMISPGIDSLFAFIYPCWCSLSVWIFYLMSIINLREVLSYSYFKYPPNFLSSCCTRAAQIGVKCEGVQMQSMIPWLSLSLQVCAPGLHFCKEFLNVTLVRWDGKLYRTGVVYFPSSKSIRL